MIHLELKSRAWSLVILLAAVSAAAQAPNTQSAGKAVDTQSAKVADLAFLAGTWEGTVDQDKTHQVCRITDPATLLCMFWLTPEGKGTEMIEIYTIRDTPAGVEERIKFFSPALREQPNDEGVTMKLARYTPSVMVFENPNGTYPKRSTLTRIGEDQFSSRVELVDAQGKETVFTAQWRRVD